MPKYRMIDTIFWEDEYIHSLSKDERYVFMYCLTSPKSHLCGCFKEQLHKIAYNTGLTKDVISKAFKRFEVDEKIRYFEEWICIKNFIKHQKMNPNQRIGVEKELKIIPLTLKAWLFETQEQRIKDETTIDFMKKHYAD